MSRIVLQVVSLMLLAGLSDALAQGGSAAASSSGTPAQDTLPVRLELGGYNYWVDHGFEYWRGLDAELWYRGNKKFIPALLFSSQTRPVGTQQYYDFLSYANWTESFYTVQSISGAPQRSDEAIFFPQVRFDIKGFWKIPPEKNFVLGAGFTEFDFGRPGSGEIYNLGGLYYRRKLVVEGNLFINQSHPGGLWSASGSLALQYGTEGKYWYGLTASGGQELYRVESLTPFDVGLTSYTLDAFYRRWLSRHIGFVLRATFQDKVDAYRRGGISARVFFEF